MQDPIGFTAYLRDCLEITDPREFDTHMTFLHSLIDHTVDLVIDESSHRIYIVRRKLVMYDKYSASRDETSLTISASQTRNHLPNASPTASSHNIGSFSSIWLKSSIVTIVLIIHIYTTPNPLSTIPPRKFPAHNFPFSPVPVPSSLHIRSHSTSYSFAKCSFLVGTATLWCSQVQ